MSMKHIIELQDLLDDPAVNGQTVAEYLRSYGAENIQVKTLTGDKGSTDFVKVLIPGSRGKSSGGDFPTLGIVGRLGGLGARPERIGFTSAMEHWPPCQRLQNWLKCMPEKTYLNVT